jgi:hypothetical protein
MRLVGQSDETRIGILVRCKLQRRDVNVDALTVEEESSDNCELRRILDRIGRVIPQEDEFCVPEAIRASDAVWNCRFSRASGPRRPKLLRRR